jgi:hypothetical protein
MFRKVGLRNRSTYTHRIRGVRIQYAVGSTVNCTEYLRKLGTVGKYQLSMVPYLSAVLRAQGKGHLVVLVM